MITFFLYIFQTCIHHKLPIVIYAQLEFDIMFRPRFDLDIHVSLYHLKVQLWRLWPNPQHRLIPKDWPSFASPPGTAWQSAPGRGLLTRRLNGAVTLATPLGDVAILWDVSALYTVATLCYIDAFWCVLLNVLIVPKRHVLVYVY